MPIHWDPKFETSDDKIDDQHRKLFDWINKLEAMRDATKDDALKAVEPFVETGCVVAPALDPRVELTQAGGFAMTYATSFYALKDRAKLAEGETGAA